MRLSVPFNGDPELLDLLRQRGLLGCVHELYFAGNPHIVPSARRPKVWKYLVTTDSGAAFDAAAYDQDLDSMLRTLGRLGVRSNLLLNFGGALTSGMLDYVGLLVDRGLGAVTVGSETILQQVVAEFAGALKVQNSVYLGAANLGGLEQLLRGGVSLLLVPPEYNHDFVTLEGISCLAQQYGAEVKLMVNEGCLKGCEWRREDQAEAASFGVRPDVVAEHVRNPSRVRVLTQPCRQYMNEHGIGGANYIHPNAIGQYSSLDAVLKIVGRSYWTDQVVEVCSAYVAQRYEGDLRSVVENFRHSLCPVPGRHSKPRFALG